MAIKYYLLRREVPAGKDEGKLLWYAQVRSGDVISFEDICEDIAEHSTATVGDVEAVLNSLVKVVATNLESGHIMDLGGLGRLRMSGGSCGTEEEEDLTAHQMKQARMIFYPGKKLRRMLEKLTYKRVNSFRNETLVEVECTQAH